MNKNKLLNQRFFMSPDEFNISSKISINKYELSKVINVGVQSGEAGYALIPRSYDKKKRQKDEDATVIDMQKWLEDQQDHLEDELKKLYSEL